ncbi:MAG: DVUA0089 family protein, partial [Myxococcales bacterium]|nr:DVUA0089 family protein [Myxococcales bacterium]
MALEADGALRLETGDGAGGCPGDTRLWIFDAEGAQVAFNDDGGVGTCSLIDTDLPAGAYTVKVDGFGGNPLAGYTLTLGYPACGNGTIERDETCDDGNLEDGDGCAADCTIEPGCGNGQLDEGEACDDGNLDAGDGCSPECAFEQVCGNG